MRAPSVLARHKLTKMTTELLRVIISAALESGLNDQPKPGFPLS